MQIHEITKLSKKRTDEGLLDSFKDAVGLGPKPPDSRTFMQKLKGEAPDMIDLSDPKNAKYAAQQKAYDEKIAAKRTEIEDYWKKKGYKVGAEAVKWRDEQDSTNSLSQAIQQVKNSPEMKAKIDDLGSDFATAMPGWELKVHSDKTNGDYYKDENGQWWNDDFPRQKVTSADAAGLQALADAGKAKEQPSPAALAAKQAAQKKGSKKQAPVTEAIGERKLQSGFFGWLRPKIELVKGADGKMISLNTARNNSPELNKRLTGAFRNLLVAAQQPNDDQIKPAFTELVTIALGGLIAEKQNQLQGDEQETQSSGSGVTTGDPLADKLSQQITPQGLDILAQDPKGMEALKDLITVKKKRGF